MWEMLYGRNAVAEALSAGRRKFDKLLIAEGARDRGPIERIQSLAGEQGVVVQRVDRRQLESLGAVNHQGVALQSEAYPYAETEEMFALARQRAEPPLLLLLDCLQDPQNLGTLLRTAEAVGVHGVIIPRHHAAQITPAVSNSSSGAVEHLLIAQVANMVRTMEEFKEHGIWVVGLDQRPSARNYREVDLNMPLALVVGSEGQGLGRLVSERCDLLIDLPIRGKINSLNASVAGSIALYEAWQRRGQPATGFSGGTG
jgi:23S rRNA (guanosine2251-2'-O)-methyltransferase